MTAKEQRVEKAWAKRGLVGLRTELLNIAKDYFFYDWEEEELVQLVAVRTYSLLPLREWRNAEDIIKGTCGLCKIESDNWSSVIMLSRQNEEALREDIGDE